MFSKWLFSTFKILYVNTTQNRPFREKWWAKCAPPETRRLRVAHLCRTTTANVVGGRRGGGVGVYSRRECRMEWSRANIAMLPKAHTRNGGDYWVDDDAPTRNAAALSEATRVRIKFKSRRTQMLLVWGGGGFIGVDM